MPLSRDALIDLAIRRYFLAVGARDLETVLDAVGGDCVMDLPAAGFTYRGRAAIAAHFADFLATFPAALFSDFVTSADEAEQRVAVRFTVALTDHANVTRRLRNCNFFDVGADGRFMRVTIWTSAAVSDGFRVGSS